MVFDMKTKLITSCNTN